MFDLVIYVYLCDTLVVLSIDWLRCKSASGVGWCYCVELLHLGVMDLGGCYVC